MASKVQAYAQLADHAAHQITGSYQEWTAFLATAGRLYKYPYPEQLLIHAQRPNATACAEYDFWNQRMRRYVRRGATGIAIIDNSGNRPFLRYVFDVSDTGGGEDTRPRLWQYREEHQDTVSAALEQRFDVSGSDLTEQFEKIAAQLAGEYWNDHQQDILRIVDGSFLEEYDEFNIGAQFRNAAAVSIAYTLMSRCGLEPENYFEHEDFLSIFDFNTPDTITELGTAVSQGSEAVLRQIEVTIKKYEREKAAERNAEHGEQSDLHPSGGLPDPQSGPAGTAGQGPGQVRENAADVSEGESSGPVQPPDAGRDPVQPPVGDRGRGEQPSGTDDAPVGGGGGGNGAVESQRSDEMGGTDELLQGPGGGNYLVGADLQLSFMPPEIPSQREQMEAIQEAESADAPSAFSIPQAEIDRVLRGYSGKLKIFDLYHQNLPARSIVAALREEYGTSGGGVVLSDGSHVFLDYRPNTGMEFWRHAADKKFIVKWPAVEKRIRQLIQEGSYLSTAEMEQYLSGHSETSPEQEAEASGSAPQGPAPMPFGADFQADYDALKKVHPGDIVLYQMGDFYEIFGPDARATFVELDLMLTSRSDPNLGRVVMCGFPVHSLDKYVQKLRERHDVTISSIGADGKRLTASYLSVEHEARNAHEAETAVLEDSAPLHVSGDTPPVPVPPSTREATQEEIDAALQNWNRDISSKRRVQQYMKDHARDKDTAAWLRAEYGGNSPAFLISFSGLNQYYYLPWPKVQRRIAQLIREDRFFTQQELDNFEDIDPAAIREQLESGKPSAFVEQVMADVGQIAASQDVPAPEPAPTVREIYEKYKPIVKNLVLADAAYQNACKNSDRDTAIIEGDAAVKRAALAVTAAEFMRLYYDMPDFRYRLHREIIDETYPALSQPQQEQTAVPTREDDEESPPWGTEVGNHSPWGKVQTSNQFADGVYEISTAGHGGIMIRETDAKNLLSPETVAVGGSEYGWLYFEEDEAAPVVIRELLDRGIPATPPFVRCEYSETHAFFQENKIYSVAEFDRLMKRADDEHTKGEAAAIKKYGTREKWYAANDPELDRFIGYDKVSFCVILTDGMRIWERQDVGDGNGGLLDYLSKREKYRDIVPILQEAAKREQAETLPPDLSGQPVIREGDTITIGSGDAAHEVDITVSDEDWQTIQEVIPGAADQPSHDPLAPAYRPGDIVYLQNTAFEIEEIGIFDVQLRDPSLPIPLLRTENKQNFERLLHLDPRNDPITSYLPADMSRVNDDFREVLTKHLLTGRDKGYISAWIRSGENNRGIAHRLSLAFASRAETVTLETGDAADYFTSTISMEVEIQDKFGTKLALSWEAVAPILRALWLQELDGFTHEPVQRESVELTGTLTYQVGDKVSFAYGDHDVSGTIEGIGDLDVIIHTGPYAWSHQTVSKDFFEDAVRHDERNAALFTPETPAAEVPPPPAPPQAEQPEVPAPSPTAVPGPATFYPGDKNGLPYDVVVQTLHFDGPEHAQPEQAPALEQDAATENFHITDDNLGVGGPRVKYRMNVEAIRTLKQIEGDGRSATEAEQEILSRYVGWGGIPDAFDPDKAAWSAEYQELKSLLTDSEYKSARASTLNAHYTSPLVIKAIYETIEKMGFEKGNILEPSCGVGNFFGLLPESMAASRLYGVELDSITGRIAQQLYPKARIAVRGYEKTDFPDGFFDLAIGNVPFGNFPAVDQRYDREKFLIHDYFFAKTIDKVRAGGVIAFITSNGISGGTMDKKDDRARRYMARRCDLLGAVRLPEGVFQANAGTDTSMSILFLQKREIPLREDEPLPEWVEAEVIERHTYVGQDGQERPGFVSMNRYFQTHPEMVLGDLEITSGPYGPQLECKPRKDEDFAQQLRTALSHIHGEIKRVELSELDEEIKEDSLIPADPTIKSYSFGVIDGEVYYRETSMMAKPDLSTAAKARVKGMVELRDCVHRLIDLQMEDADELTVQEERQTLNSLYDAFTKRHGLINSRENALVFSADSSYYLLCSLEVLDNDGRLERKADMFTKRTIKPHRAVTHVDTASEALAVSIGEKARVDMPYMAQLTGKTEAELESELSGVIFRDIQCQGDPSRKDWSLEDVDSFPLVAADEYLSGNVRHKLRAAKAMFDALPNGEKHRLRPNVEALESAQPKDLTASEIDLRLGATWLDKRYVQQFMYEQFKTPPVQKKKIFVNFSEYTGEWNITGKNTVSGYDVAANTTYGTDRLNAYHILEDTLNLRDVRVYDTVRDPDGKERRVLNRDATTLAQQKQQAIKDAFRDWIWKDPQRRQALVKQYNELFNSIRPREYDGRHIVFGGINPEITLREHQLNAIAHVLYGNNTLLAHEVGAGKTFEMAAAAMESKRLGLCQKSLFAVPNHLIEQWASEFLRLYPTANILVASKKDFEGRNRKKFCSRIATGNYDAIIMGHSQFERLPVSYERREQLLQDQIYEIEQGIEELEDSGAERFSVKQLERTKRSLEARLEKLNTTARKDNSVTFEQLGVDRLFIDEAHSYKNLFLYTKMRNVAGLSTSDAQKSSDMLLKCRYMDEITGGRGVVFATGTPVSNSMTELFTMQRYLQQDLLEKGFTDSRGKHYSLTHFDSWASIFGETVTKVELAPEGKYRPRTRFARFYNLPELMAMFRETADIKTADQLHLPVPEVEFHTEKALPSEEQKQLVRELSDRAAAVHTGQVNPKIDNMLKITSDGRKLGLDQRLINPLFPDNPDSKLNMCVKNVFRIWEDGQADKLTQLIFCDLSTPKAAAAATRDRTAMAAGNKVAGGTELHALGNLMEDIKPDAPFSVYEDIRDKLIAMGIPAREIAFIHDANTDAKKKELFAKVRSGRVRVLMGSTFKMGAGMNVQDRLIALHDLDCPWRPGDLEQRKGRIVRQGNRNPTVHIYRYVTEGTFDSYLWQTVENKQKFISQIMTSKSPVRSCEDVDETALSYAEIKALCAGNPLIKEKMDLDIDVARLRLLKSDHQSNQYRMEDDLLKRFPEKIKENEGFIAGLEADMKTLAEHPHPMVPVTVEKPPQADGEQPATDAPATPVAEAPAVEFKQGFAGMVIGDQTFTDKIEAGKALIAEIRKGVKPGEPVEVGTYRGFSMALSVEDFGRTFVLTLKGQMTHRAELGDDVLGNLLRIDHALNKMPDRVTALHSQLDNLHQQMKEIQGEIGKPFPQETELQQKSARLAELNRQLGINDEQAPVGEQLLEKDARPSVLEGLKRPVQPKQKTDKLKEHHQER